METLEPPIHEPRGDEPGVGGDPAGGPLDDVRVEADPIESLSQPVVVPPPVVAVVVTRDDGPGLEAALRGLADSDYPSLTVLVVHTGPGTDPTARVAAVLPGAFVRHHDGTPGFAAAVNEAVGGVQGATFVLALRDDVVLDPPAIRLLVEEAYRSNAAIVGPKLVDDRRPDVLLEVGLSIDRFGVAFSGIEPGEVDQEQHDSVRDVFYVSDVAVLVRSDLFTELGGFDEATDPGGEDLDLCWRARIAGARVMVAPDARARLRRQPSDDGTAEVPERQRNRVRALLKSYSTVTLLWVVPLALLLNLLEMIVFVVTRRGVRARAVLGAWVFNLRHLGELRRARSAAQGTRRVHDSDLRYLQVGGSARMRAFVATHLHVDSRLRELGDSSRAAVVVAQARGRQPAALAALVFGTLVVIGSRALVLDGVPAVGSFLPWGSVGDLLATFTSPWRFTGLGSPAPASPAFGVLAVAGTTLLGATSLARTVVVVGALPFGAWGAYRLARPIAPGPAPALVTAVAYGINPVARNALALGELGPLVFYALAPFMAHLLFRGAGWAVGRRDRAPRRLTVRSIVALGALVAGAAAVWPPALVAMVGMAVVLGAAALVAGGGRGVAMLVLRSALGAAVALVLLMPWPLALVSAESPGVALGLWSAAGTDLSQVLRFESGPAGAGVAGWGLLLAASLPLLLGAGSRLTWAIRAWALAVVSFAAVWLPARFAPDTAVAAPEGVLVPAALGLAIAVGLGVAAFTEDVRSVRFGWRQVASIAAAGALVLPALGFAVDAVDGRWGLPPRDWREALAWMPSEVDEGGFRVLWAGDPQVLPLDPEIRDGVGMGLTIDGPGDAEVLWPSPGRSADALVGDALQLARTGRTSRLGHLLAPMGVRYVAVPERTGPGADVTAPAPDDLVTALDDQLDLGSLESEPGLRLYENAAWVATRALAPDSSTVPLDSRSPTAAALRTDLSVAQPITGPRRDSAPVPPGLVLWSQASDPGWRATANGENLERVEPFGWATGFEHPTEGRVGISHSGTSRRLLAVVGEAGVAVVVVLLVLGVHRRWRRRPAPGTRDPEPAP